MKRIAEMLGNICNSPVLNFEKETSGGYEDYDDRIYIDGDISFDTMAKIVDYLREQNNK